MARNTVISTLVSSRHIQTIYQTKVILKFCMLAILGTAFFCLAFYFSMDKEVNTGYAQAHGNLRLVKSAILNTFLLSEGVSIFVLGIAVAVLMVFMSHRIAGPLWRIEKTAKTVGSGNFAQKIHLRNNDEMRPLSDKMNDMMGELGSFVDDLSEEHGRLDKDIALLKERRSDGGVPPGELRTIAGRIMDGSKTLSARLSGTKTK